MLHTMYVLFHLILLAITLIKNMNVNSVFMFIFEPLLKVMVPENIALVVDSITYSHPKPFSIYIY